MSIGAGNRAYYPGLDILKFGLSVLIVAAHCAFLKEAPDLIYRFIGTLEGFAVPSFFAVSAFIFCSKIDNPGILKHTLKRIVRIFGVWYVLMFPVAYYTFIRHCNIKELLFAIALSCTFQSYWFFKALFINISMLYFSIKWKKCLFYVGLTGGALIFLGWNYNKLLHFFEPSFSAYFAFFYHIGAVFIGALCYKLYERNALKRLSPAALLLMLAVGVAFSMAYMQEVYCVVQLIIPLILIPLFLQLRITDEHRCKRLRELSILYFAMQFFFMWLYGFTLKTVAPQYPWLLSVMDISLVKFAAIMGPVYVLSNIVLKYEHRYEFLKYLH